MAARDQARIINIGFNDPDASLTNSDYHPFVRDWCQKFFNHGGLVFLPSGNKAGAFDDTPRTQSMIVVSGFGRDTHLLNDSATGYSTWFSGPGDQILCESRTGAIVSRHGTSYSSAIVAGIAALTWSVNQNLSNTQVLDTLVQATGRNRPSVMFGYGLPDANTAVNLAQCTNTRAGQGQADNRNLSSPGAGPAAH
jgi:subtilisin family serine protease